MTNPAPLPNLDLDRARLDFERKKWKVEQDLQRQALELRAAEAKRSGWSNPLAIAIFTVAVAMLGNAGIAFVNTSKQAQVEQVRAEAARILEVVKTSDPDKAAANLRFLTETGLLADSNLRREILEYLDKREPGKGISLPLLDPNRPIQLSESAR